MAKKPRTPAPPTQGPKRRDSSPNTGSSPLQAVPVWAFLAAGVGVLAIVAVIVMSSLGGSKKADPAALKATMAAAGCTLRDVKPYPPKDGQNFHNDVPKLTSPTHWSTFPPAAGGHYAAWAVWGFYRTAVNPRQVVHNEEHGAVVIWWGPQVPSSTVDQLEKFYNEVPNGMFGTPIAGLGSKIALTAWTGDSSRYYQNGYYGIGHVATCTHFDEKAFAAFRDAYRDKGPEGTPASYNDPGMGPQ